MLPSPGWFAKTARWLWVRRSRIWTGWRTALVIVKRETVVAWHRQSFWLWWAGKSRGRTGRPTVPADVRTLIRTMAQTNPRWGAPRIHGQLLKLGIDVCQATVAKYMVRRRQPPSQTWRTFLRNHIAQIVTADFFVVLTATYRLSSPWYSSPTIGDASGTSRSPAIPQRRGRRDNCARRFPGTRRLDT